MAVRSRNQKFSKEAQKNSAFGRAISAGLSDSNKKLMNAIEFIEGPTGLGITLRPVQRVVAKCLFGVPLDFRPAWADRIPNWGKVEMWDVYREKLIRTVTEEEYLHIAYNEGRCNVDNWQDIPNVGKTWGGYNEACIFAGRRGGKALGMDELIPTPNGFVRNADLKGGDVVLSPTGQPVRVKYAHEPFEAEVYRVNFDDGTSVVAHGGHLWHTYTRKERKNLNRRQERPRTRAVAAGMCGCGCSTPLEQASVPKLTRRYRRGHFPRPDMGQIRTTEEIRATLLAKTGKKVGANHAVQLPNAVELPWRNLPLDPYVLGAWLGDGRKTGGNGFTAADRDAPEILRNFTLAGFTWKKARWRQQWNVYGLTKVLRRMGLLRNKHIPHEYLWASKEQRLALLQGLMDTDGSCMADGQCEFSNTERRLAEGVYHLAASLGLKPYWAEKQPICTNTKTGRKRCTTAYVVRWTGMTPVFRLSRKLARIPKTIKSTQNWRYIVSVEPIGTQTVRCITVDDPKGLFLFGKNFNVTHNSELVAAITCYKLYLLLNIRSPQEFFGLVPGSPIDITYLAQDEKGADRLFKKLREDVNRAAFFEPFLKDNTSKALTFVCEADRHKRDITPTLTVWSLPCTTNAVRGPSSVFLALDEFAHFRSAKGSTSEDMYASATPSTGEFHHVERVYEDGTSEAYVARNEEEEASEEYQEEYLEQTEDISEQVYEKNVTADRQYQEIDIQDSMIFSISSPLKRVGKMYELHRLSMDEGAGSSIFTLNCSSAEMNNKLLPKFLKSEYKKSTATFKAEYGGQFLESSESYVTEVAVKACVDAEWDDKGLPIPGSYRTNVIHFTPEQIGRQYFWGFDLGMTNDASALAIAHLEFGGAAGGIKLVFDYIDRMMVGEHFEGPGIDHMPGDGKYEKYQVLDLQDILRWLRAMNRIMPCFRGATDQHGGQQLVQLFELNEIHNMELLNLTPAINSQMAYALRGYIENKLCSFPYVPKFITELKLVELEVASKYQIRVQAPLEKGSHDDMADAAQICAFLAQKWLIEEGNLHLDPTGLSLLMQAQQNRTPTPIQDVDGVPLQTLRVLDKVKKVQTNLGYSMGTAPRSPFNRRGRR